MSGARKDDEHETGAGPVNTGRYEIRVKGHLDPRWAAWFDSLHLTHGADGTTSLCGHVVDQTALHGLLQRVRDLGIPLISVTQVEPEPSDAPHPGPR